MSRATANLRLHLNADNREALLECGWATIKCIALCWLLKVTLPNCDKRPNLRWLGQILCLTTVCYSTVVLHEIDKVGRKNMTVKLIPSGNTKKLDSTLATSSWYGARDWYGLGTRSVARTLFGQSVELVSLGKQKQCKRHFINRFLRNLYLCKTLSQSCCVDIILFFESIRKIDILRMLDVWLWQKKHARVVWIYSILKWHSKIVLRTGVASDCT